MAGIGFNLKKILEGDTFIDLIKAGFYSALITSGPWLISASSILFLSLLAPSSMDPFELIFFRTVVTYIYAFSLIAVGLFHLSVTRYVADKLFSKEKQSIVPTFNSSALILLIIQALLGLLIFNSTDQGFIVEFWIYITYLAVSMMWLVMIFLTTLRDYKAVTWSFFIGALITILLSVFLAKPFGLTGYMASFAIGHLVILVLLASRFFIEFQSHLAFDVGLLNFLSKNKTLILLGVLYNAAIWIDKMVFWMSPQAVKVSHFLRIYPSYDTAVFFAFLTIIPALAIFLLIVETDFYLHYRDFYTEIIEQASFKHIEQKKRDIADSLRRGMRILVQYQGSFTLMVIAFAPDIIRIFGLKGIDAPLFRVVTFAAFLHVLFLMIFIIILYFDFKKTALLVTTVFLVTNGLFTYWSTQLNTVAFFGYGYLIAAFISLILSFYLLDYRVKRLEFFTFAPQPIGTHREKEIA